MQNIFKNIQDYTEKHWLSTLILTLTLAILASSLLAIGQNIWFDEGYSIFVAQKPIAELISLVSVDAHPPLYYLVLKLWGIIFSWNEFSLRFLSILFATSAIALSFFIIKRISNVKIALSVLPFLILAPFALRYSYEIRPYAMTSMLVAAGTLVMLYASAAKKRMLWIFYAAIVATGMLTLYMSALVWIAHLAWLLFSSFKYKEATPAKVWLSSYVLSIIFFLPWLPTFIDQYLNSALPGIGKHLNLESATETVSHFTFYKQPWQTNEFNLLLLVALAVLTTILATKLWSKNNQKTHKSLLFIAFLTITPLFALLILNGLSSNPFYISRYLAHFSIFYYMALGFIITSSYKYFPKISTLAAIVSFTVLAIGVTNLAKTGNFNFERNQKPVMLEVAQSIDCNPQTTIVAQDEYTYLDSWFYFQNCDLKFLKEGEVSSRGGYAPLKGSAAQIQNVNEVKTDQLIFISWKDKNNTAIFADNNYKLYSTELYDSHQLEFYYHTVNEE